MGTLFSCKKVENSQSHKNNSNQNSVNRTLYNANENCTTTTTTTTTAYNNNNNNITANNNNNNNTANNNNNNNANINTNNKYFSNNEGKQNHPILTEKEQKMVNIANENKQIVINKKYAIGTAEVIDDSRHSEIEIVLNDRGPSHHGTWVNVNDYSTIQTTIECHENDETKKICILNFADALKPGGGYLNGRSPQEETLCRQTLLYPTLTNKNSWKLYSDNRSNKQNAIDHDTMIYSKDVYVIRDDSYELIDHPFQINIISSAAVDNRKGNIENSQKIMERRIRKIIKLAAYEENDILILGAFGCGIFKNDPKDISKIYRKILIEEGMKDYFESVWIPVYKSERLFDIFSYGFPPRTKHH